MTTNPEWVWCSADHRGRDVRIDAWPYVKGERWNSVPTQGVAPPAIYVRRDAVEAETTALRRERDALRLHLAAVLGCFEENEAGVLPEHAAVFIEAKCALVRAETTASAAGKGVG